MSAAPIRLAVAPPPMPRPLIVRGMKGSDVQYIQEILQREGFFDGTPLGNFGDITEASVTHFQNTHIDESGKLLEADGKVGKNTWWALHNPNGSAQRNYTPPEGCAECVTAETGPRAKFLKFQLDLHAKGIKEIPDGSNYGDGVTPIVNACGFRYGIAWCLAAQSYAFRETTGDKPLGKAMFVHCSTFWNEALKLGKAHVKNKYTPTPGDIVIYNYAGGLKSNGTLEGPGHAAALAQLSTAGDRFNAFEGNMGNRFKFTTRSVSERILVGFVNLWGDESAPPKFKRGLAEAPTIAASYSDTR